MRKKVSDMTEDEQEIFRQKRREYYKNNSEKILAKRREKKEKLTDEEREERRRIGREYGKRFRESRTEEQKEEKKESAREFACKNLEENREEINAKRRARRANRTEEQKEKQRERDKQYRKNRLEKHRDEINAKKKEDRRNWTESERIKDRERHQKYYLKHKEEIIANSKNRYDNKKEEISAQAKIRYVETRERKLEYQKEYYKNNIYGTDYNKINYWNNREESLARSHEYYKKHSKELISYQKKYYSELVNKLYGILGEKCAICGIEDRQFLTIDHIHNNGKEDRDKNGGLGGMLRNLKKMGWDGEYIRSNLQTLCYNHNLAKGKRLYLDKPANDLTSSERSKLKLLKETFDFFGPCEVCGESDLHYLTIDHRHNDGSVKRKNGEPGGRKLYLRFRTMGWPEELKENYGCLCFNHNCGKDRIILI